VTFPSSDRQNKIAGHSMEGVALIMNMPYWYAMELWHEREDDLRRQAAHDALVRLSQGGAGNKRGRRWRRAFGRGSVRAA
jgi:hypothetical protein